ncbi:GntR family transcriptional regulator [Marinobacter persicus]|uniref:Pyruvate dehydrogenase complex repressor n=1 Tax=Marinobacter persicus TaxID=930118 RepID=A0A2S6GA23_9GAMM|nr:GntR family transcriptional regulator [Marinobacter persicus]PPK53211.1 GntR family transcriptional regulator [Marinobacter persicus]PPK56048.1 GntR family transcriptional regulator [Marinobacter persicus]PPK59643.1 GntR family transcriptional regulator [Marinobacter persicus]
MPINQIAPKRLADTIVEQLESMILEGTLQPGQRLPPERALAEQFGVSRPSLREAVQRLTAKGLLNSRQGGGNYVTENLGASFSDPLITLLESHPEAHRDLLEFRRTLEADCAYYAAQRATEIDREYLAQAWQELEACYQNTTDSQQDPERESMADARFHLAIAEASHNAVLLHTMRNLFSMLKNNILTSINGMYARETKTRQELIEQHRKLYAAIGEGRADDARAIAGRHIEFVQRAISEHSESERRRERALRRESRGNTR